MAGKGSRVRSVIGEPGCSQCKSSEGPAHTLPGEQNTLICSISHQEVHSVLASAKEIIKPVKCLCTEQHSPVSARTPVLQLPVWPCLAHTALAQPVPSSTAESHFPHPLCKPLNYAPAFSQTILTRPFSPPLQVRWRKMVRRNRRRLAQDFPWDEQQNNNQEEPAASSGFCLPLALQIRTYPTRKRDTTPCSATAPLCIFPGSHFSPHTSQLHLCYVW